MTLTDTGPLVALVDKKDPGHDKCKTAVASLQPGPLLTTWPCLTEGMHLVYRAGGYPAQKLLWELLESGGLLLHEAKTTEVEQMIALMEKYRDMPMDLADASLIAAAERLSMKRIFTLDTDFYAYRLADGSALEVIP